MDSRCYSSYIFLHKITMNLTLSSTSVEWLLKLQAIIPNPLNLPCVCHKDETLDENGLLYNWSDNLFWGTHKDNTRDMWKKWRANNNLVLNHPKPILWKFWKDNHLSKKVNQYTLEWEFIRSWYSMADVQRELCIFYTSISACCKQKAKTAGWFIWKYA